MTRMMGVGEMGGVGLTGRDYVGPHASLSEEGIGESIKKSLELLGVDSVGAVHLDDEERKRFEKWKIIFWNQTDV